MIISSRHKTNKKYDWFRVETILIKNILVFEKEKFQKEKYNMFDGLKFYISVVSSISNVYI